MSRIRLITHLLSLIVLLSGHAFSFVGQCNDSLPHTASALLSGEVFTTEMDHNTQAHQEMSQHEMPDHDMMAMGNACCDQECDDCDMSHYNPQVTYFSDLSFLNASSHNQFLLSLELTSSPSSPFKPPIVS